VVEDEAEIRRFVRQALEAAGYRVAEAETLRRGLVEAGTRRPDLVVLDLGLPDGDGVDFIREMRAWSSTPIVVLSARTEERDKVEALDAGADDYLTKPFGVDELLARVRASLRRGGPLPDSNARFSFGDVQVDLSARQLIKSGKEVHLTRREYGLLIALLTHPGKVLTHRHLLKEVWGPAYIEHAHYLRIYMARLRQKLEDDATRPKYLMTETGLGYRFVGNSDSADQGRRG
jgi:two-component system KDP operon response regulator KdpE